MPTLAPSWARLARVTLILAALGSARSSRADDGGVVDSRVRDVHALIQGTLDTAVEPQTLFDVGLADEDAVLIERVRLDALLRSFDAGIGNEAIEGLPSQWAGRLALDRARLEFYALPKARREELVREHTARRQALSPPETPELMRARVAEEDRLRAIEMAQASRAEAERVVGEELALLSGLEQAVVEAQAQLAAERERLASRRDVILGWQRRVREARARSAEEVDSTYDALRRALRASRDELDGALDALESTSSKIPEVGSGRLDELPTEFNATEARDRREAVRALVRQVRVEERVLLRDSAEALMEEITSLNRERLGLLADLSPDKRAATVGLTEAGFDQARAEGRHLLLILRYHRDIASHWVASLRRRGELEGMTLWRVVGVAVPWVIVALVFVWWRRRSPRLFALAEERVALSDRHERRTTPSRVHRALVLLRGTHRSIEWLALFGALVWLLPSEALALLEVQLLNAVVGWSLAGAFVINAINALATSSALSRSSSSDEVARLRLRSLRLVGRVFIGFVLVLFVTARLVGEGTLYHWVWSTIGIAAIPVFLLLVRWWRKTVFERLDRVRRKSRLQVWLLANQQGWKSFFSAMVAAVQLFVTGAYKVARSWLAEFDLARKIHAYLYKRELDRLASEGAATVSLPLSQDALDRLSPEAKLARWVPCSADEAVERLRKRLAEGAGGIIAIVGERGQGKSALLQRLADSIEGVQTIHCESDTSAASIRGTLEAQQEATPAFLLDDAHLLVKPVLGGLRAFDEVLELARRSSGRPLWVFSLDAVLWPFLRRARDSRPLFDEVIELSPWTDEQIGAILTTRSDAAGLTPVFDDLLERLPASSDEVDRLEALAARRAGYFRMVWDYTRGNPGIALEAWRSSLVQGADGRVFVRPLVVPDTTQLESLPDSTLFVLRAVLQMAPVAAADVAAATRLPEAQVLSAFRFGRAHGFLCDEGGKARITWPWLRAVVVLLERRHLLVSA